MECAAEHLRFLRIHFLKLCKDTQKVRVLETGAGLVPGNLNTTGLVCPSQMDSCPQEIARPSGPCELG